jgi:nucleoside-diphosphate-sugar epimerase
MSLGPKSSRVLVLGATGNVGRHVVTHALEAGDEVHVFVRTPGKLPQAVKAQLHVVEGDLADARAVVKAVEDIAPTAIIVCSGQPPRAKIAPLNAVAIRAIVDALSAQGRLHDCFVVYLSGLFSDTIHDPLPWYAKLVRGILVPLSGYQASLADNLAVTRYLTTGEGSKTGLNFTIVRMGYPVDVPSKGEIIPVDYFPSGSVAFTDMGLFLVRLAHGARRAEVLGKTIKPSYAKHLRSA